MTGRPLAARTVVLTRSERASATLRRSLEDLGADVIDFPVTAQVPVERAADHVRAALADLVSGEWVLVTSPNGAEAVASSQPARPDLRYAAVGSATAAVLSGAGLPVALVPVDQRAVGLVAELPHGPHRAVFVGAETVGPELVDGLVGKGWQVRRVVAYRTVPAVVYPERATSVAAADAIVFAAGSAVRAYVDVMGHSYLPPIIASIGPTTTAAATALGVTVSGTADEPSAVMTLLVDLLG